MDSTAFNIAVDGIHAVVKTMHNVGAWFTHRFPERAYNLVLRRDWQPVRFLLAFAFLLVAVPEQFFLIEITSASPVYSSIYTVATCTSLASGVFYLIVSTSDVQRTNSKAFQQRYVTEIGMLAMWLWVFIIDIQAHGRGMLRMGDVEWQHNIGVNLILSLALVCCILNNMSFSFRAEMHEQYDEKHSEFAHHE
jgi:hypothetical protein